MTDYSETDEIKDTALSTKQDSGLYVSAVALSSSKVFVAYCAKNTDNKYVLECLIFTIKNNSISIGTVLTIINNATTPLFNIISLVKLNENKVFIAHSAGSYNLYGTVCNISGTTITKGTSTQLSTTNSGKVISAVKLDEGKVFIAHSLNPTGNINEQYLYSIVCTISGTTITKGTDTSISSTTKTGSYISVVKLNNGKVFIGHSWGNNYILYGIVCTVSGTTITKGTDTQLSALTNSGRIISVAKLNEDKVIIIHNKDNDYSLNALVCNISGNAITVGTDTVLNSNTNTGKVISAVALSENNVQIVHGDSNNYLYSMLCDISRTTITKRTDTLLSSAENSGSTISAVALSENNIFIGHSFGTNNYLYGMIIGYLENLVKTITSSTEQINGVAITDGQVGEMVQVKKPDEMLEITLNATITAGGNSISWNNVKLSHRRHLDGDNRVYTASKTISINNVTYTIKFYITYVENSGWRIGFECPPGMYFKESTDKYTNIYWLSSITKPVVRSETYYTGANNTGTQISVTANITDVTI